MQLCHTESSKEIWPVPDDLPFNVDPKTFLLKSALPMGPPGKRDKLARPNIKMFTDETWVPGRTMVQRKQFDEFHNSLDDDTKLVVFEVACGQSNPKIRKISEDFVAKAKHATLIRVNPKDWQIPDGHILLSMGGLEAITRVDKEVTKAENSKN